MKKFFTIVSFHILMLASLSLAQGIGHGVEVRLTSPKLLEVEPGRIVTGSFLISNETTNEEEFLQNVTLPRGWRSISSYEYPVLLAAGVKKVQLVTVIVPRNCAAGRYEITYSLTSRIDPNLIALDAFSVVVLPVIKLDALVDDKPEVVLAGDEYKVRIRLTNNGNSTTAMKIRAHGNPDFPLTVDPVDVTLVAGQSDVADVLVTTDSKLTSATNHVLEIKAETQDVHGNSVSTERTVLVKILPKLAAGIDQRYKVPSQLRFISLSDRNEGGFQVEYSGSGNLDENGRRNINFLFRGPDVQDRSIYGTRDVLCLNYSDQLLDLTFGDRGYALSPLSERLHYGRGVEAGVRPKNTQVGAFYVETRWEEPSQKEVGAYLSHMFSNILRIKGNYLNKRKAENSTDSGYATNIYTAEANIRLGSMNNLGLEYAYSLSDKNGNWKGFAHRASLDGRLSTRFWYTFENIYSGPRFYGYYNDVLFSSGTIAFPIYRGLRSNISYRIFKNNLDLDPAKNAATREQSYRAVLSYPFATGTSVSLDFENLHRKDDLVPGEFDYEQNIWRLGLGQTCRRFGVQTYSELATFDDKFLGNTNKYLDSYSVYAYVWPSHQQTYTIFARSGYNGYTGEPARTKSVGISSSLRLNQSVNLSITYNKNNFDSDRILQQDILLSALDLTLPNRHSISLKARWLGFHNGNEDDYAFYVAYSIPFEIPANKRKSFGVLRGKIYDGDKVGAPPLSNVILSVNDISAVTNQNGEFVFPQLQPGSYSLWVDQKSIGLKNIATTSLPVEVDVEGGKTTVQEIGISSACKISGTITLYAFETGKNFDVVSNAQSSNMFLAGSGSAKSQFSEADLIETGSLSQILIEISNGTEILRQLTDDKGQFSFDGIRPGEWHLRVYDHNIPQHHYVEKESIQIGLVKGDAKEISVRVLPYIRTIRMLERRIVK